MLDRRPPKRGFDFTSAMRRLCGEFVRRLPELGHIELDRVAIVFRQSRRRVLRGLQASLTPLRFAGGSLVGTVRGRCVSIQRVVDSAGREMLYVLTFYLPRYLDLDLREKLATAIHELWHIGPRFDGDLRRHAGRCYAHTRSQADYERHVKRLVQRWLASNPPVDSYDFLRFTFSELTQRYGCVIGTKLRPPKLIPLDTDQRGAGRKTQDPSSG